jgi:hypothetical protein
VSGRVFWPLWVAWSAFWIWVFIGAVQKVLA